MRLMEHMFDLGAFVTMKFCLEIQFECDVSITY